MGGLTHAAAKIFAMKRQQELDDQARKIFDWADRYKAAGNLVLTVIQEQKFAKGMFGLNRLLGSKELLIKAVLTNTESKKLIAVETWSVSEYAPEVSGWFAEVTQATFKL